MSTPLSFCMVTTFFPPHHFGGDAVYVHRLSDELARRGHRVTVVYAPDAFEALRGRVGPMPALHANVRVVPLRGRLGRVAPTATYLTGRPLFRSGQLEQLFGGERFDVVHFHNISLAGGPGILSYGEGVKLYTTHEHWLVCPMHVLWRLNREPCERPTCFRCQLAFRRPPQLWRTGGLLEREARHVDLFLSPSRFTIEAHRRRGFAGPMRHLPLFLPLREGTASLPAQSVRPYVLSVGRLERLKGLHTLIDVFRRYDHADLVIVGDGTQGAALRAQAAGAPNIRFTGYLPFTELDDLYTGALAVVVPSIGYETFGIVTLEAFARGTPAVVRDLGALPEPVRDSGGGFVFATDAELVDVLERLRTDPTLRDELGERGRRAYLERWSEEPHLAAYLGIVDELRRG